MSKSEITQNMTIVTLGEDGFLAFFIPEEESNSTGMCAKGATIKEAEANLNELLNKVLKTHLERIS